MNQTGEQSALANSATRNSKMIQICLLSMVTETNTRKGHRHHAVSLSISNRWSKITKLVKLKARNEWNAMFCILFYRIMARKGTPSCSVSVAGKVPFTLSTSFHRETDKPNSCKIWMAKFMTSISQVVNRWGEGEGNQYGLTEQSVS